MVLLGLALGRYNSVPYDRPLLATLVNRVISDLEYRVPGLDARLRFSFENALAHAEGGLAHGLHGHLFHLSRQILPDTGEESTVRRWAGILNIPPRDPSKSTGLLNLTGTNTTVHPAGSLWRRNDGLEFVTDEEVTISGGAATVAITASEVGSDYNTPGGATFTIVSPQTGITSSATVDGNGTTGGADAETVASLLERVLDRLRTPPSGGGPGDYERWTKEVSGVTRVWVTPNGQGAGTVVVRFAVDGEVSPIPSGAKVDEVQAYLETKHPITAGIYVVAPTAVALDPNIALTPDTTAVRTAVTAELEAYILRAADPRGTTYYISQIREAISLAAGEQNHTLVSPAADVVHTAGQLLVLGTITWS